MTLPTMTGNALTAEDWNRVLPHVEARQGRSALMPVGGRVGQLVDVLEQRDQFGAFGFAGAV